jgi:RHS repeat-associated protein
MDTHSVQDMSNFTTVTNTYDHTDKHGAVFYPLKDRPIDSFTKYAAPGTSGDVGVDVSTSCSFVLLYAGTGPYTANATLVNLDSCTQDLKEAQYAEGANLGVYRRVRVKTTYESKFGYGYVTEQDTAIGTDDDFVSKKNETIQVTRSGFTDNSAAWIVGKAGTESVSWWVPARADTGTAGASLTRTRNYNYEPTNGALSIMTVEPGNADDRVYQWTGYERNAYGQLTRVTVHAKNDERTRFMAADYNTVGEIFPDAVRVGGTSYLKGESVPQQKTTLTYDQGTGLLLQTIDPNGLADSRQYDTFGRLLMEQRTDGSVVSRQYSGGTPSVPYEILSTSGQKQIDEIYESRGLVALVKEVDDVGEWFVATQLSHEPHGWLSQRTRPYAVKDGKATYATSFTYDSMGRIGQEIDPIGSTIWEYSGLTTNRTTVVDSGSWRDYTVKDQSGRIVSSEELVGALPTTPAGLAGKPHMIPTTYVYGPFNTLSDVYDSRDSSGHNIHAEFDLRGRRKSLTDSDTGLHKFAFNTYGDVEEASQEAINHRQKYGYDVLGRMISEETSESGSTTPTSFTWDTAPNGIGKLASSTSQPDGVSVAYEYDQQGRKSAETRGIGVGSYRLDFGYDDNARLASIIYPQAAGDRYSVKYGYSSMTGELQTVSDGDGSPIWTVGSRNPDRRVLQETLGDQSTSVYSYEPQRGFLQEAQFYPSNSRVPTIDVSLTHDVRGYLSSRSSYLTYQTGASPSSLVKETFMHDELGRLVHWASASGDASGAWSVHYDYDDIGNIRDRDFKSSDGSEQKYSYTSGPTSDGTSQYWGGPHAVTSVAYSQNGGSSTPFIQSYNYDPAGRQSQSNTQSGNRTVTYTDFDLPRSIATGGTAPQRWDYSYDAAHHRASKANSDGSNTIYVGKLYEKRTDVALDVYHVMYVYGEAGAIVAQVGRPDSGGTTTIDYPRRDQLGSVTHVSSDDGSSTEMRFDPFGARLGTNAPPSASSNPLPRMTTGFIGQENEDDLGLINLNGRIYDPNVMRFLSADPIISRPMNSQGYNPYSYAYNSPLAFVDPSGLCSDGESDSLSICSGGGGGGGGGDGGSGNGNGADTGGDNGGPGGGGGSGQVIPGAGSGNHPPYVPPTPPTPYTGPNYSVGTDSFSTSFGFGGNVWGAPTIGNGSGEGTSSQIQNSERGTAAGNGVTILTDQQFQRLVNGPPEGELLTMAAAMAQIQGHAVVAMGIGGQAGIGFLNFNLGGGTFLIFDQFGGMGLAFQTVNQIGPLVGGTVGLQGFASGAGMIEEAGGMSVGVGVEAGPLSGGVDYGSGGLSLTHVGEGFGTTFGAGITVTQTTVVPIIHGTATFINGKLLQP